MIHLPRDTHAPTRSSLVLAVGIAAQFAAGSPLHAQTDPVPEDVDAIFAEWDLPDSPGCALGVYRDGEIVYRKGYGMANLDWEIPIDPATVFYVGSVSKQFTAAAIALLILGGDLSLDDDIRQYLPELPAYESPVTVGHLLHHTGGMRDMYATMVAEGVDIFDIVSDEEAIELLSRQDLDFPPGEEFSYSNGGYFLLAQIVERVSGMSFNEFTRTNLFEPLGMDDTHFHDDPGHIIRARAMSYETDDAGQTKQNYVSTFDFVGQGGLYTTVGDLIQWDRNFYESHLGGAGFTDFMLTRGVLTNGEEIPYALGLQHMEYRGQTVIDHAGGMMGFRADLVRFPDQHFSVSALCNHSDIDPSALTRRVADLYLADVLEPISP